MFFNFSPLSFGIGTQPQRPQQPNNGGFLNSINDFLHNGFMNPFFRPNNEGVQQMQQPQQPRPTFARASSKRQAQNKEKQKQSLKKTQPIYNQNTGMYWKQKGNVAFKQGDYQTALKYYSKAIELNGSQSIFYSNRARCLKKIGKLQQALKDAQEAVQLQSENIKGHMICGQILAQIGKQTKNQDKIKIAINRLTKALTLCSGQKKLQYQRELSIYIYRAKKLLWYFKFIEIREQRINAINQYKKYLENDPNISKEQLQIKIQKFIDATNETVVFHIPDYLCCRITLDLMEDPVTTDCGQSYERSAIQLHIQKNGKTDPFTRKPISGVLYPSINLKKAILQFLQNNPWAYEYSQNQNFNDIAF